MKEITILINLEDAIRNYLMFKKPLDNQLPELIRLKKCLGYLDEFRLANQPNGRGMYTCDLSDCSHFEDGLCTYGDECPRR